MAVGSTAEILDFGSAIEGDDKKRRNSKMETPGRGGGVQPPAEKAADWGETVD